MEEFKEKGRGEFIREQNKKWICKRCGMTICVHKESCIVCGSVNPYFPVNSE
jgi:rubrerythrin